MLVDVEDAASNLWVGAADGLCVLDSARSAACCKKCAVSEPGDSVVLLCCSSGEEVVFCACGSCTEVSNTGSGADSSSDSLRLICLKAGGWLGIVGWFLVVRSWF